MKIKIGDYPRRGDRKINIDIDPSDTWNLDQTLSFIILPALLQLRDTSHSYPAKFAEVGGEDYHHQMSFDFYAESHTDALEIKQKEWLEILNKMIWAFQQLAVESYEDKYHYGEARYDFIPLPSGGSKMIPKTSNYWFDSVGQEEHQKRIQEGIDLFAEYYRDLWD